jgi:hypothetical protein
MKWVSMGCSFGFEKSVKTAGGELAEHAAGLGN